jgi:hypothetical protein
MTLHGTSYAWWVIGRRTYDVPEGDHPALRTATMGSLRVEPSTPETR